MKSILIPAFAVLVMGQSLSLGAAPPAKEESITQELHNLWVKSKAYLSDDWATFKEGAQLTLADLSKQIDAVALKTGANTPGYFQLRLQALKEQRGYLTTKLGELDSETIKVHMSGPRYAFDKCVSSLEAAITQADNEADVLVRLKADIK
jgi:hypothetical protein